jgi:sugar phosphate isomerase/epimerase
VIDTAAKARELIEEMGSPYLGVTLDPANLVTMATLANTGRVVDHAFEKLGRWIALAHAKDITAGEDDVRRVSPGQSVLDFGYYLALLWKAGFTDGLILHDVEESQVASSISHFNRLLEETGWPVSSTMA